MQSVDGLNGFFGKLAPGLHGVVFDEASAERVVGHIDVVPEPIAGTGFLFAPAIISLADTLCAAGCGGNIPEGSSFTTVELVVTNETSGKTLALFRCTQMVIERR